MTSKDTPKSTSSPASADGPSLFDWQDGPTTAPSGPEAAHVNLSAQPVKDEASRTSDISGLRCSGSSESAALQSFLESRLQAKLASDGSVLYALTWKMRDTPPQGSISALRASAHRTSGSGSGGSVSGWATPRATDPKCGSTYTERCEGKDLPKDATLSGWPTPRTPTGGSESAARKQELGRTESGGGDLQAAAIMAGWPAPMAGTPAQNGNNAAGNNDSSRKTVWLVENGPARITADGQMLTGSSAEMESGGQLNPSFSRWLMGYPRSWDLCAQAVLKQRKRK